MEKMVNFIQKIVKPLLLIVVGSVILAIGINLYISPNNIAPGGLSGIGITLKYLFGWKIGIVMLVLNIPVFILGTILIGMKFGWKSFIGTVVLSFAIDLTAPFLTPITHNLLLASVFGGVVSGIGLAMVFMAGATTGGTDLIAQILHKYIPFISVGKLLMFCDGCVVVFATIVFKNYELAMYDIVTIFITSKIIDTILEGFDYAKAVFIISDYTDEISKRLMDELERGVTGLNATGMYKKVDKTVLLCVLKRNEVSALKEITKAIDKNAFVILTDVREVLGEGFKPM